MLLDDAVQRSALFFDTLRRRGNQTLTHYHAGKPPVLIFDYGVMLDGASFKRACNYLLPRIVPPEDAPTDPAKQPFVVVDPRTGHGPNISGSKESSQAGGARFSEINEGICSSFRAPRYAPSPTRPAPSWRARTAFTVRINGRTEPIIPIIQRDEHGGALQEPRHCLVRRPRGVGG